MTPGIGSPETAVGFTFVESKRERCFQSGGWWADEADGQGFLFVRLSDTHWGFRGYFDDYVRFPRTMK